MRKIEVLIIVSILFVVALISGCTEVQTWGNGDLPDEWCGYFGDNNMARLNYVQTNSINTQGQLIAELAESVRKLEDPNDLRRLDNAVQKR